MSPNGEPGAPVLGTAPTSAASLPPMSTFRGNSVVASSGPTPGSLQYNHSPGATNTPVPSTNSTTNNQAPAPDTIGKTLASVVSKRVRLNVHFIFNYSSENSLFLAFSLNYYK